MLRSGCTERETEVIAEHAHHLDELGRKGVMILFGRTQTTHDDTFGLVIFKADSETEACQIMEDDPAVKHGVMRATLYPYRIVFLGSL